jgi:hypothetical protein
MIFFRPQIFLGVPQGGLTIKKSRLLKFLQHYVVGILHLCLKKPESTKKESAQSDHPTQRKHMKCVKILEYLDVGPKQQNWTTYCTFSLGRVVGLS